jgi:hypothetical protein
VRFAKAGVALAVLLALLLPFGAEAGGKGAVRAVIYVASVYPAAPDSTVTRTYGDGPAVGFAILNATTEDTMTMMVKIQDGLPGTTFTVTVVPALAWSAGPFELTTDGKGKGSLTEEFPIPDLYVQNGVAPIKVILTSGDDIYATDDRDPPFVNPPDAYPGSTAHPVNLK